MKKQFFIFFMLLCFAVIHLQAAAEQSTNRDWVKLTKYIYIDKKSITQDGYWTYGWFKRYSSDDHYLYSLAGVPISYELVKFAAYCSDDGLDLKHVKEFDKEGRLILDEPNNYNGFPSYSGFVDGEIYFNALCKYRNGE